MAGMPASARVPAKLRMAQERLGHESACKSDVFRDAVMIALLRKQRLPAHINTFEIDRVEISILGIIFEII